MDTLKDVDSRVPMYLCTPSSSSENLFLKALYLHKKPYYPWLAENNVIRILMTPLAFKTNGLLGIFMFSDVAAPYTIGL